MAKFKVSSISPKEAVDMLNDLLYEKYGDNYSGDVFWLKSNYHYNIISFGNITIYHSEDNNREFSEKHNEYECLFEYCKKEFYRITKEMFELATDLIKKDVVEEYSEDLSGRYAEIVDCVHCHEFEIGDIVLIDYSGYSRNGKCYRASKDGYEWWIYPSEFKLVEKNK